MAQDHESPKSTAVNADANVLHSPSSNYAKERVKWESHYTPLGAPQRPYVKREYPMMLLLAGPPEGGLGAITVIAHETVHSEREREDWERRGYRPTPAEAIDAYEAQQLEFAKLAAEQNWDVKNRLSPKAAAEVEAAQDAHSGHLPVVPETPIVRRQLKDQTGVSVKETK